MNSIMPFIQQNWMFVAAFVVVVTLLIANEINSARGKKYRMSVTDALREYNDDNAVFIDIRSKKDFKKLHIPNAVNIPAAELEKRLESLAQFESKQIIVYSDTDPRANEACIKLRKMHPNAPLNVLVGGIVGWQEANLPLSKD
ncbi:MAG TPA: rhodanese-like domain-containing protein [Candidatus Ignatzschineria merdigallinarum]|uniref:Rhodanese-like domain-containing protein n=1 Tax=Candidatus Ignatzschineria merdigallinarum TaxID=2838621 RepID=A0A9D1TVD6_9GAMM|nr:rhodanese-like domain-containing protein [Candidatus Ignatzschineria merdigallinarum]